MSIVMKSSVKNLKKPNLNARFFVENKNKINEIKIVCFDKVFVKISFYCLFSKEIEKI